MLQWEFLCSQTIRRYLIIKSLPTCDYAVECVCVFCNSGVCVLMKRSFFFQ